MNIASYRLRAAASLTSSVAVVAALALVFGVVLGTGRAATSPLLAGFEARSYAPGQVAVLDIRGGQTNRVTLQVFQAGASGTPGAGRCSGLGQAHLRQARDGAEASAAAVRQAGAGSCTSASARTGRAATTWPA